MRAELKRYGRALFPLLLGLALILISLGLASCREDVAVETQRVRTKRHTFQDGVVVTDNGTVLHTSGYPYLSIDVAGIVTGTVAFEQTVNGTDWRAFEAVNTSDGSKSTTATADGTWVVGNVGVYDYVRVRVSSWTSGTITVMGQAAASVGESVADVTISDVTTGTVSVDDGGNVLSVDDAGGSLTVDASELVTIAGAVTGSEMQVDIVSDGAGLATDTKLDDIILDTADIEIAVEAISGTVAGSEIQVDIVADGAGLATSANQLADGHNVTVDNAAAGSAVNIQDGGNTITVDGTVTADTELPAAAALADAAANPTVPTAGSAQLLYNATTVNANWDRERNNWAEWPFPSLQRTASSWVQLINYNARGAYIVVNITGIGLNQSLTVSAQLYDYDGAGSEASDQQETIWSSAALTPTGRHSYLIYPGAGAAAQDVVATVSYPLPRLWNVSATLNNSQPITFSIGVHYVN